MNEIIASDCGAFYISYNPDPCEGLLMFDTDLIGGETALVYPIEKDGIGRDFYVLNGDFRKEYKEVMDNGLDACIEIYNKYKTRHISTWSVDYFEEEHLF